MDKIIKKRILVIDEETDLFTLFKIKFRREIKKQMVQFQFFTDPYEALNYVEENPEEKFDFVLIDVNVPMAFDVTYLKNLKEFNTDQKIFIFGLGKGNIIPKEDLEKLPLEGVFARPINFYKVKHTFLN